MLKLLLLATFGSLTLAGLVIPTTDLLTFSNLAVMEGKWFTDNLYDKLLQNVNSSLATLLPNAANSSGVLTDVLILPWLPDMPPRVSTFIVRVFQLFSEKTQRPFGLLYETIFDDFCCKKPKNFTFWKPFGNLMFNFGINTNLQTSGQIGVGKIVIYKLLV